MHSLRRGGTASPRRYADAPELADAVARLARASVLVVGDAMLDRYIFGHLAPAGLDGAAPVLEVERELALPGGAVNVVRNLTALGAAVAFVSVVGDDQTGSDLTGLIGGQPGVEPWLLVQGGRTTTLRTRYVADGAPVLRADQEDTGPIHAKLAERLLRIARDSMAATAATVLSDYGKGVLAEDMPQLLIGAARQARRPVIVDPRGAECARYAGADVIVPTRRELAEATGLPVETDAEAAAAAINLRERHGFGAVLVLRGDAAMTLADAEGARQFPADPPDGIDAASVGDSVIATLAAGLAVGMELAMAVRLASVAAGVVAGKAGTAMVAQDSELLSALAG